MKKKGGPFKSFAVLGAIFEKNGLQDGGQNRSKIDINVIQNLIIFVFSLNIMLEGFVDENSLENRSKNDAEIDSNNIIKADIQNVEILVSVEARSSKTRFQQSSNPSKVDEKSMSKVGSFPGRSWDRIFNRFWIDFCSKLGGKIESKSI